MDDYNLGFLIAKDFLKNEGRYSSYEEVNEDGFDEGDYANVEERSLEENFSHKRTVTTFNYIRSKVGRRGQGGVGEAKAGATSKGQRKQERRHAMVLKRVACQSP